MKCSSSALGKEKEHLMNIWLVVIYMKTPAYNECGIKFRLNALFSIQVYKCSL